MNSFFINDFLEHFYGELRSVPNVVEKGIGMSYPIGKPRIKDSNSIKIGPEELKLIKNFEKLAIKEGFEASEIDDFKKQYVESLAKDRLNWENQLIDVEQLFREVWSIDVEQ